VTAADTGVVLKFLFCACFAFGLSWIPLARADDSSRGVALPAFTVQPPGSFVPSSSSISLQGDTVEVRVAGRVPSGSQAGLTLALPGFEWLGAGQPYPDRHFPELTFKLENANAPVTETVKVEYRGADITETVRAADLDPFAIADTPPFVAPSAAKQPAAQELMRLGALATDGDNFLARWTAARTLRLDVPSGDKHTLILAYRVRPAFALFQRSALSTGRQLSAYCVTASQLADAEIWANGQTILFEYVIPAGVSDSQPVPIKMRDLGADGRSMAMVAFCTANGAAFVGSARQSDSVVLTDPAGTAHILAAQIPGR
jgi:hypothetical protein